MDLEKVLYFFMQFSFDVSLYISFFFTKFIIMTGEIHTGMKFESCCPLVVVAYMHKIRQHLNDPILHSRSCQLINFGVTWCTH